jgi:tRNA(Phe) wybutosine-synthesizing methylase Tyw3
MLASHTTASFSLTTCSSQLVCFSKLIFNMSKFSTALDCQDLQGLFQMSHRKFQRACTQMSLLDDRIKDMQTRYRRAIKNNKNAFRYSLRQRLAVMSGVKMMFYEYASAQADKMDALRDQMEDQLYAQAPDSESDFNSDDSDLEY